MTTYRLLRDGKFYSSEIAGKYAGWGPGKIFGRLDCKSGMRMKKENRVFFLNLEDAVSSGFRPCKNCMPIDKNDFENIRQLVSVQTLNEFYNLH